MTAKRQGAPFEPEAEPEALGLSWAELAEACGGRLAAGAGADPAGAIVTDTRGLAPGQVFWALRGPRFDPHEFLTADLARSCDGWVVEAGRLERAPARPRHAVEAVDTLSALQRLAAFHRGRFSPILAAVTGSNGKTTTKEMLRGILERAGPTIATQGNLNNHIGVPLSLLRLRPRHRYGVFELGASREGEIRLLAGMVRPKVAILTNIGPAHIEFFGGLEGTLKAKCEILDGLGEDGVAVINRDDPRLAPLETRLKGRCVSFGLRQGAQVRWEGAETLDMSGSRMSVKLSALGSVNKLNAAAAAAAAGAMGIGSDAIRQGLEDYRPAAMRLEAREHPSGCRIVIDAYNANPASMRAGIEAFCEAYPREAKIVVLGDMKELGSFSPEYHRELGAWLKTLPLSAAYLAGAEFAPAREALRGAPFKVSYAGAPSEWLAQLRAELAPGRAIFFKASRGMKFEEIVAAL